MAKDRVEIDILATHKKAIAGFAAVAASMAGVISIIKSSVQAYTEQVVAESKLSAILKSTGNQLGMTKAQLVAYAGQLQDLTGVGDELIVNSEAVMATFTKIGKDVFPRAISAALDLSKAYGQDLKSSTIQIGKALQDPIKGIGALGKVGVQLSESQVKSIHKFMEMNDIASAQNVIMKELETQVGGVAAAYGKTIPGQIDIFKASLGDIQETIGQVVMVGMAPLLQKANEFMAANKQKIINIISNLPQLFILTMQLVGDIIRKALSWDGLSKSIGAIAKGFFETWKVSIQMIPDLFMSVLSFLLTPVKNFGAWVGSIFQNIFGNVANFFIDALNAIPFVELERVTVKPIEDFGDMGKRTLDEMGTKFEDMKNKAWKAIEAIGSKWKQAGDDLAGVYKDEINTYLTKVDTIVNAEGIVTEEILENNRKVKEDYTKIAIEKQKATSKIIEEHKKQVDEQKKLDAEYWEGVKSQYAAFEKIASDITSRLSSIISMAYENQLVDIDNKFQKEKAAIEGSALSEEEKQEKIAQLEEKYAKKKAKIKHDEAVAEKMWSVTKSIIDTASAVVEALPNVFLAATVGVLGAAQTAMIAAQPIPAFAQGGSFITSGPQTIMVGDNPSGRERVTVEPLSGNRQDRYYVLSIDGHEFRAWLQERVDTGDLRTVQR